MKKTATKTVFISARVTPELKARYERLAKRKERSLSFAVEWVLKKNIEEIEKSNPFDNPAHQPAGEFDLAA